MKKKFLIYLIIIALFCLFLTSFSVLAQKELLVEYPTILGVEKPETTQTHISVFLKYIYNFAIFIAGFLSFVLLIWAGIQYLGSTGNPVRLKKATGQIGASLLGLIIIFSSYLILNTINPELLIFDFSDISIETVEIEIPEEVNTPAIKFQEIPLGTIITSEINLSSFIAAETVTDPDCDGEEYGDTFSDIVHYPTDYQGSLEGRRLKRIHEVASTTLPAVDMLALLSEDLKYLTGKLNEKDDELVVLATACDCAVCICLALPMPGTCGTTPCPKCSGDPCLFRTRMNELREDVIPYYYTEDDDPIPCKILEIEYLSGAFEAFLDDSSQLVKNEDNEDDKGQSYYYSNKAEELRGKIEACIGAGSEHWVNAELTTGDYEKIEEQYDEIEELIDLMAGVENKGTYTPKTDPPERDIETNINHLETILIFLEFTKAVLNPEHPAGCFPQPYSFFQRDQLADSLNIDIEIVPVDIEGAPTASILVREDPATFYCPLAPIDSPRGIMLSEEMPADTTCEPIIEIPVGKTLDEAIDLTADILRELGDPDNIPRETWDPEGLGKKGIWNMGHLIIDELFKEQKKYTEEIFVLSDTLIDLTSEDNCINKCQDVPCEPICFPYTIPVLFGIPIQMRSCIPPCFGPDPCRTLAQIIQTGSQIQTKASNVETLYQQILNSKESIFESFFKLNSEYPKKYLHLGKWITHPEARERASIGEDICCNASDGYCRNPDTGDLIFAPDKAEEKGYTLKEKLIQIQKLLNRTRDFGTYVILIEDLIDRKLATRREIDNIPIGLIADLSNCDVVIADLTKQVESSSQRILENCWLASSINFNHIRAETCSFDPPYDCEYFDAKFPKKKSSLLCYCFEQSFYSELASNFFCCSVVKE